jgi:hypothetical protein
MGNSVHYSSIRVDGYEYVYKYLTSLVSTPRLIENRYTSNNLL